MDIGVSILTNGARLEYLQACIESFLANCFYRPIRIAIFDNGSTDKTHSWCSERIGKGYGIEWAYNRSETDLGCAAGTNKAAEMVRDCKYVLHLESDFRALPEHLSGCDKFWLHRAIEFMDTGACDYLYLRRMINERDIGLHWWSQWFGQIDRTVDKYMECSNFWWSNNPHLRRNEAMYASGCLPLNEELDGDKGTPNWSHPELKAGNPGKSWLHKWGIFVHESLDNHPFETMKGCGNCKYGLFLPTGSPFCIFCDSGKDYTDMHKHYERFSAHVHK